jgi:hypothetical protein
MTTAEATMRAKTLAPPPNTASRAGAAPAASMATPSSIIAMPSAAQRYSRRRKWVSSRTHIATTARQGSTTPA